jgi:hypothetical protein
MRPQDRAAVQRALVVGPQGASLGLDSVLGLARVRITDHGSPGTHMPPGQAIVEVWGGKPVEVYQQVAQRRPAGVLVAIRWHPATWWVRALQWARWRVFLVVDRWRVWRS